MSGFMKILIVYYTRTGTTGRLVDLLARMLDADVEPIIEIDGRPRRDGIRGYLRCVFDVLTQKDTKLIPSRVDFNAYDIVVVATPVWNRRAATPVVAWLKQYGAQLHHVAWLCSLRGHGSKGAFGQMRDVAHKSPVALCEIREEDLRCGADYELLNEFAGKLRERVAMIESWKLVA